MKFCEKCGKQLEDDAVICTGCGCPTDKWKKTRETSEDFSQYAVVKEKKPFPWSLISLIFGIVGIVTGISGLPGVIFGVVGLVLSKTGKKKAPEDTRFKIATILSIVAIVIGGLVVAFSLIRTLFVLIITLMA